MNWFEIRQIKRFTPIKQLFNDKGTIKDRPVYDLGNGFFISFTDRMFRIDGKERVEFGEEGEYALNAYFFLNKNELEMYFKLKEPLLYNDYLLGEKFRVFDEISIDSTFEEVNKTLRSDPSYQDGETRALRDGNFQFQNSYIMWKEFNLFFFERSKKAKLTGFQYTFSE